MAIDDDEERDPERIAIIGALRAMDEVGADEALALVELGEEGDYPKREIIPNMMELGRDGTLARLKASYGNDEKRWRDEIIGALNALVQKKAKAPAPITVDEAVRRFPFLIDIGLQQHVYGPITIDVGESLDEEFLKRTLLENESEAAGHEHVEQRLYAVSGDNKPIAVGVRRSSTKIYPPEYLHPGTEYPPDEDGHSETVGEALARWKEMSASWKDYEVRIVLVHKTRSRGFVGDPKANPYYNELAVRLVDAASK